MAEACAVCGVVPDPKKPATLLIRCADERLLCPGCFDKPEVVEIPVNDRTNDQLERDAKAPRCPSCGSTEGSFSRYCGVWVCARCDHHKGLARCFCGWAADGGNGRQQLEEDGERIDEDY